MAVSATISAVPIAGQIALSSFLASPGGFPDKINFPMGERTLHITNIINPIIESPPKLFSGIEILEADERLSTEDILEMVDAGSIKYTVADNHSF